MKIGEEIRFIFPSQLAYGYRGDGLKIKPNMPLIFNVTLLDISKNQTQIIK
jgi:FKBP-type peptidyl-prolyl cis-trans isomerase